MIPGIVSIVLNLVVIGLLIATIIFALRLSRQLSAVKDSRSELEGLVREFAESTAQADASVQGMKKTAAESGEALSAMIQRARTLKDELEIIVQAADVLADRLETASGRARQGQAAPAPAAARPTAPAAPLQATRPVAAGPEPRSKAERDLLQAMENLRP